MPRVSRNKPVRRHESAAQPSKRGFAVPTSQVNEVVLPGSGLDLPISEALSGQSSTSKPKRTLKPPPSTLAPNLPSHPYSRSHNRREKRKTKQNLAGGQLDSIAAALSESIGEPIAPITRVRTAAERDEEKRKVEEGRKVGEGKGRTLREKDRRKQIAIEAKRIPAVMSHPAFKQSPWETIRIHAGNSLAMKGNDESAKAKDSPSAKRYSNRMEGIE